jgi:hypothetical protein
LQIKILEYDKNTTKFVTRSYLVFDAPWIRCIHFKMQKNWIHNIRDGLTKFARATGTLETKYLKWKP